jgi:NAD(P)-dependent dehydrogenase (short-subunit alcohol dehydrogenase family)
MDIRAGSIAVVTGGGSGIGRALCRQLAAAGVHVATCDVDDDGMAGTRTLALQGAPAGTRFTTARADVSREADVLAFRDAVLAGHSSDHVDLVFSNAGIGGGSSFVAGDRAEWDRTFGVCWGGVYNVARAFMPLLVASREAMLVNVSSVNGFWAALRAGVPHTAYSAAKFAVKGFTEALITDLRTNAPHVKCAVVMPGHIGTSIMRNSGRAHGYGDALEMSAERVATVREQMVRAGFPVAALPDDTIRALLHQRNEEFRDKAPTTPEQAATIILDGVRAGRWRILVGEDAHELDRRVRADPEHAYDGGLQEVFASMRDMK